MNFLDSYIEAGSRIRNRQARHEFYGAIIDYFVSDGGEVPPFKHEVAEVAFWGVKYSVDKARAGRFGGQANGQAKRQAKRQANGQAKAKRTANETRTKEKEEESKEDTPNGVSKKAPPFEAPTAEEVGAYAESQGIAIDAARFVDFYASNGWMVGRVPMADWRAAARRWGERAAPAKPRPRPRRCPKCGAQISKSTQTGKWECGACGGTWGELP